MPKKIDKGYGVECKCVQAKGQKGLRLSPSMTVNVSADIAVDLMLAQATLCLTGGGGVCGALPLCHVRA